MICLPSRRSACVRSSVRSVGEPRHVAAGRERLAGAGQHDGAPGLGLQRAEQLAEVVVQRPSTAFTAESGWSIVATSTSPSRSSPIVSTAATVPARGQRRVGVRLSVVLGEWLDRPIEADLAVAVEADRLGYPRCGSARWPSSTRRRWRRRSSPARRDRAVPRSARRHRPLAGADRPGHRRPSPHADGARTSPSARRATSSPAGTATGAGARRAAATPADVRRCSPARGSTASGSASRRPGRPDGGRVRSAGRRSPRGADRMVLNMVTVGCRRRLAAHHPNTAVWLAAAVDPTPEERRWMSLGYVGYLRRRGTARCSPSRLRRPRRVRPHAPPPQGAGRPLPDELLDAVALVGDGGRRAPRIDEYAAAGVTEIGLVVPPLDSPAGRRTLEALAPAPASDVGRTEVLRERPYSTVTTGWIEVVAVSTGRGGGGRASRRAWGDLQVLGRDVGVAQAALQHVGRVDARAAGEGERRVGDLGAAPRR